MGGRQWYESVHTYIQLYSSTFAHLGQKDALFVCIDCKIKLNIDIHVILLYSLCSKLVVSITKLCKFQSIDIFDNFSCSVTAFKNLVG